MTSHAASTGLAVVGVFVVAATILPAFGDETPPTELTTVTFAPFSKSGWGFTPGGEFPGAKGSVEKAVDAERGCEVLKLHYDFTGGGAYVGARGTFPRTGRAGALLLDVKAPKGASVFFRFFDKTGQVFQKVQAAEVDGWQSYRVEIAPPWQAVFGGSGSKRIHWPMQGVMLAINKSGPAAGVVEFADLTVESLPPTPQQLRVEHGQEAFEQRRHKWRSTWLDCLDHATAIEDLIDRSVRLESYGVPVDAGVRNEISARTKSLWSRIDAAGGEFEGAAVAGVGRAETDQELATTLKFADEAEARLDAAEAASRTLLDEATAKIGKEWLRSDDPPVPRWIPGADSKDTFADRWLFVLSHVKEEDFPTGIIRPADFPAVMTEAIWGVMLNPDGTLDEKALAYQHRMTKAADAAGFAMVPNYFNVGFTRARGPQLPQWFIDRHGLENAVIRPDPDNQMNTPNFWYPPTMELIVDFVAKSAAAFDGDTRIIAFEFENEPMMYQFHEVYGNKWVRKAFGEWLKQRYQNVAGLNERWGTDYQSFDQAEPPAGFHVLEYDAARDTMSRTFDFRLFLRESFADYYRQVVKAFHDNNSMHPIMPQFMSYFNFHQDNMLDTFLDSSVGWDLIVGHEGGGRLSYFEGHWGFGDMNYLASHGAILNTPTCADEYIWNHPEAVPDRALQLYGQALDVAAVRRAGRRNMWEQLAWGKAGVIAFSLNPSSSWGNQIMGAGRLEPVAGSLMRMRPVAEKVRTITSKTQVQFAPVAMLETLDATYVSTPAEIPLNEARVLNFFCAMRNLPVSYLPERALMAKQASLDGFKVIVAPYCTLLSQSLADDLARWVNDGGYLIASGPIGLKDGYGRTDGALAELLPFNAELTPPDGSRDVAPLRLDDGVTIDMKPWRHILWRAGKAKLPANTRLVASLEGGTPLITETRCGKGWIVQSLVPLGMLSTSLGGAEAHFKQGHPESRIPLGDPEQAFQQMLWDILLRHGDPRPVRADAKLATLLRHRDDKGGEYLFVINMDPVNTATIDMTIPERFANCRDLMLNGCPVPVRAIEGGTGGTALSMTLAPGDGTILELIR